MTSNRLSATFLALSALLGCVGGDRPGQTKSLFGALNFRLLTAAALAQDQLAAATVSLAAMIDDPSGQGAFVYPTCSGVVLSGGLVATAGHCQGPEFAVDPRRLAAAGQEGLMNLVAFGDQLRAVFKGELDGAALPSQIASRDGVLKAELVTRLADVDGALYRLVGGSQPIGIPRPTNPAVMGDGARLLGFPNGLPLTESGLCTLVEDPDDGRYLRHDCDSLTGSSGGLVVDRAGQPVAIQVSGPGANSAAFFAAHGRHETAAELAVRRGCPEGDQTCIVAKGMNRALRLTSFP